MSIIKSQVVRRAGGMQIMPGILWKAPNEAYNYDGDYDMPSHHTTARGAYESDISPQKYHHDRILLWPGDKLYTGHFWPFSLVLPADPARPMSHILAPMTDHHPTNSTQVASEGEHLLALQNETSYPSSRFDSWGSVNTSNDPFQRALHRLT